MEIHALVNVIENGRDPNVEVFDLNGDRRVVWSDVDYLVRDLLGTNYGDADLNGKVDFADFLLLSAAIDQPGGWENGNFNGGSVQFSDFLILADNFGSNQTERVPGNVR